MGDIESTVRKFIVRNIMLQQNENAIELDTPLLEEGIITSFAIVELVGYLEKEFGVTIADHEVLPENFATVESISNLVKGKK